MSYKSILWMLLAVIAGFVIGALLDLPPRKTIRFENSLYEIPKRVIQDSNKIA